MVLFFGGIKMEEREKEIQNQIDTMKEIRKRAGLNRREFSEYMGIRSQKNAGLCSSINCLQNRDRGIF